MKNINIKTLKTSRNYATALFETALSQNAENIVFSDISLVEETVNENAELEKFLNNPIIKAEDKKSALIQIFGSKISQISQNFIFLLADNSRFDAITEIVNEYKNLKDLNNNIKVIKAVTAVDMNSYLKDKLKNKLESMLNSKVEIEYKTDSEIVGGLIVEIDGKIIDNSVLTQLNKIKKQII